MKLKTMRHKSFFKTTGVLFTVIASVHVMRIVLDWEVTVGGGSMPMWVSWLSVPFLAYLAYSAFKLSRQQ